MKIYIVTFEDGGKMKINAYSYSRIDHSYVFNIEGGYFTPFGDVTEVKELL